MDNNAIFRRLRYTFDWTDEEVIRLYKLVEKDVTRADVCDWLKPEEDETFKKLHDIDLARLLNGFIITLRGRQDGLLPKPEKTLNNNLIFRKLKIALSLKDTDILDIYDLVGMSISKHEINAIFRKPGQKQYRDCKDQFLRNFLMGLQKKHRGE